MFDFFRDIKNEMSGIDVEVAAEERKEKIEKKKQSYFIFSTKMKIIIFTMAVIYLIFSGINIAVVLKLNGEFYLLIKYIFLAALAIGICICLIIKKKNSEIMAIIGIFLFIVLNYFSLFLLQ